MDNWSGSLTEGDVVSAWETSNSFKSVRVSVDEVLSGVEWLQLLKVLLYLLSLSGRCLLGCQPLPTEVDSTVELYYSEFAACWES